MRSNILPDEIHRSSRKTLSISIDGQGRLIVRAPKRCAEERIFAFINEKEGWIRKKQAERRQTAIPLPPSDLEGYALPFLGGALTLSLTDGSRILRVGEELFLPQTKGREGLIQWLKQTAKKLLVGETAKWAAIMEAEYSSVSITSAKTRWGSCSADNSIRYTFRLLYCPKEIIEYVVVHELAHTRYKDHSKLFWREVERYCPDWRTRRKWLKAHGILMEIL